MAFTYRVYERTNKIANAKTPKVAVAAAKMVGRVSTKELAEDIANRCTVHRADVLAVLDVLSTSAMHFLSMGQGVQLGELGSFALSIRGQSAPTKAEFKPELLQKAMVRYTPSVEMKNKLSSVGFMDIEQLLASKKAATKPTDPTEPSVPTDPENSGGGTVGEI